MGRFRLDIPYILGLLAVGILVAYWVIAAIVRGDNLLVIPILVAVGVAGSGIGLYVAWLFRTKVLKK